MICVFQILTPLLDFVNFLVWEPSIHYHSKNVFLRNGYSNTTYSLEVFALTFLSSFHKEANVLPSNYYQIPHLLLFVSLMYIHISFLGVFKISPKRYRSNIFESLLSTNWIRSGLLFFPSNIWVRILLPTGTSHLSPQNYHQ